MPQLGATPLRELGLTIAGTSLEPILAAFEQEIRAAGLRRLHPRYYLSTEWGVPYPSISIGIPFYLARPDLRAFHLEKTGLVEGQDADDILRYLRHELGHVVNYAYRLHDEPDWVETFGTMLQPYVDEYSPQPFSRRHVQHLPGWYAQMHPDEDWAETFAVWMTPGGRWREEYATWPEALAKLEYCDRTIRRVADLEPLVTATDADDDVSDVELTLDELHADEAADQDADGAEDPEITPQGIDGALRAIFTGGDRPAGSLLSRLEKEIAVSVYRWTGHDPDRTRALVRRLARRTETLSYPPEEEQAVAVRLTVLITTLAMTHQQRRRT